MNHSKGKTINEELIQRYSAKQQYTFANADAAREARFVFAWFRKNRNLGYPIYIQAGGKHTYKLFEICTPEERSGYFLTLKKQWQSQYFDTLLPLKEVMSRQELDDMHVTNLFDELEGVFENER